MLREQTSSMKCSQTWAKTSTGEAKEPVENWRRQCVDFGWATPPGLPARHGAQPGGHVARHSSAVSGLPWSYTPSRGRGTSTGIDPSPIHRKMTSRLGSVGQRCPPVSGEGSGKGGMLVSDSHYCRAVTTSTSRIHASPHTGRTSQQTRLPHCGGGPLNYSQHWRASVGKNRG
ncbi:hypothetical protein PoB_007347100 [Plakobranchus ocellatus]|uniref:Uncharacterized protein n=1 Tax=Plakobranchus ocellatus TaxID=259542 RepID=A0AAV4DT17_9GAST|nr:hypothetical protein PoB_007347100 [Plakobranchus ocellatus]